MPFNDTRDRARTRLIDHLESLDRLAHRVYAKGKLLGIVFISVIGVLFLASVVTLFAFNAFWGWAVGKQGPCTRPAA